MIRRTTMTGSALSLAAALLVLAISAPAEAGRNDRPNFDRRHHPKHVDQRHDRFNRKPNRPGRHVVKRIERVERVWVPGHYKTVYEKVWVPPVTRTEYKKVWVEHRKPGVSISVGNENFRFVYRDGHRYGGHYEMQRCEVVIHPGYYKTVKRRIYVPGGWTTHRK